MARKTLLGAFNNFTDEIEEEFRSSSLMVYDDIQSASPTALVNSQGSKKAWIKPKFSANGMSFTISNPADYMEILYFGRRVDPGTGKMQGSLQLPDGFEPIIDKWFRDTKTRIDNIRG